jgi:hypothetical protein
MAKATLTKGKNGAVKVKWVQGDPSLADDLTHLHTLAAMLQDQALGVVEQIEEARKKWSRKGGCPMCGEHL